MSNRRRKLFYELLLSHAHFLGDPGTGKSAKRLLPLNSRAIASGEVSVIILDAKGELTQFDNVREEAERADVPFKYFTNRVG